MKLPEKVRISLDLVKKLRESSHTKPRKVTDLAVEVKTTDAFLWQIVSKLGKEGIVNVVRGPGGGVTASLNPTSALNIYQAMGYLNETDVANTASGEVVRQLKDFLKGVEV
jgi:DNA-binding IscR family transcriptional regulator